MRFSRYLFATSLMVVTVTASADAWYELIRYTCDPRQNFVRVEYIGAYNEEGREMMNNKTKDEWDPWKLLEFDQKSDGQFIKQGKSVRRSCVLNKVKYVAEIRPLPCNHNTQGMGGASMMAHAKITTANASVASVSFGACSVVGSTVTTSVTISPNHPPVIKQVSGDEYFQ